jgi:hypothetical protein
MTHWFVLSIQETSSLNNKLQLLPYTWDSRYRHLAFIVLLQSLLIEYKVHLGLWGYSKTCLGMWTTFPNYVWCKFYLLKLMFGFLDLNFLCSLSFLALWLNVQLLIELISFWFCKLLFDFVGSCIFQVFRVFKFVDFWLHELVLDCLVLLIFIFVFCWGFFYFVSSWSFSNFTSGGGC